MLTVLERSSLPISLDVVKQHLRVRHTAEDELISLYIEAAIDHIETLTGVVGAPTTFEERYEGLDCEGKLVLTRGPIREVASVSYLDEDYASNEITAGDWLFEETAEGGFVYWSDDYSLPTVTSRPGPIRVVYNAGFDIGEESGTGDVPALRLPPKFRQAVFLLVGHWFANRETVNVGNIVNNMPLAFDTLANQLRVFR